jgi:hypothetical protein
MLHSTRPYRSRSDVPREWVRAGRILLVINVIVLILSAFTEHLWTWDHFLRGGQDFELSLLALLAFFCLILVFANYFRRRVSDLLDRDSGSCLTADLCAPSLRAAPTLLAVFAERPPGHTHGLGLSSVILRI